MQKIKGYKIVFMKIYMAWVLSLAWSTLYAQEKASFVSEGLQQAIEVVLVKHKKDMNDTKVLEKGR